MANQLRQPTIGKNKDFPGYVTKADDNIYSQFENGVNERGYLLPVSEIEGAG